MVDGPPHLHPTSDQRPRCYVASPLGFTDGGRHYYRQVVLPALSSVVTPVDPWTLTSPAEIDDARATGELHAMMLALGRRNADAIRSSPLFAAVLEGQELDSGTVAELGYAGALGKICVGLRSDFRRCGEDGATLNWQVEAFLVESGGQVVATLEELVEVLAAAVRSLGA